MYTIDYAFLLHELITGFLYLPFTLGLAAAPVAIGLVLGGFLAVIRVQRVPIVQHIIKWYIVIIRGLPTVLLLLIVYFSFVYSFDSLAELLHLSLRSGKIPPVVFAIIVLSFISIAFMSESVRAALLSVGTGQIEAAQSIGMTTPMIYRRVIIPQALPVAIPILGNTFIGQIKGVALVSMIGVKDIVTQVRIEANANYRYLEAYIAVAVVYWVICLGIEQGIRLLNHLVRSHVKEAAV
jgi:His/Glu/Gln/Arg/opine family amino acid ABC transporter permease subunit